jgi:Tfp pilus assembly protein PilN
VDLGSAAPVASAAPAAAPGTPGAAAIDTTAPDTQPDLVFNLTGRTIDIQAYTRFLRQLEASPWIHNVTPVSAQTVVEKERPVTAFSIRATYHRADSAYIRTAPFSQSVR